MKSVTVLAYLIITFSGLPDTTRNHLRAPDFLVGWDTPLDPRGVSHPTRKSGALKWFLVVSGSPEKVIMREANTVRDFNWRVFKWRAG